MKINGLAIVVTETRPDLDERFAGPACNIRFDLEYAAGSYASGRIRPAPILEITRSSLAHLLRLMVRSGLVLRLDIRQAEDWSDRPLCTNEAHIPEWIEAIETHISTRTRRPVPFIYVSGIPPQHAYQTNLLVQELMEVGDDEALWDRVIAEGVVVCRIDDDTCSVSTTCDSIDQIRPWVREALELSSSTIKWSQR